MSKATKAKKPQNCCAGMDYALEHKMFDTRFQFHVGDRNGKTGCQMNEFIALSPPKSEKSVRPIVIVYCPWCGKKQQQPA